MEVSGVFSSLLEFFASEFDPTLCLDPADPLCQSLVFDSPSKPIHQAGIQTPCSLIQTNLQLAPMSGAGCARPVVGRCPDVGTLRHWLECQLILAQIGNLLHVGGRTQNQPSLFLLLLLSS